MSDESSSSDDSLQDNPYQIVEFCGEENDQGQKMIEIINSKWMHRESKNTNKDDFASTQRRLKRLYKNRTDVESHISDSDSSGPQDILSKKRGAAMLKTSSSLKPQHGVAEDKDSLPVRSTSIHPRWKSSARCDTPPCISSTKAQTTDTADHSQKRPEEGINPTQTRGEKKTELQKRLEDLHHKGKADSQTKLLIDYLDAKFELITLKLQDEIQSAKRAQQYDLGKKVEDLKNSIAAPASDNKGDASARALLGVQLPIATLDEFEKFEQMLDPKSEVNAVNPEAALEKQALLKRVMKISAQGIQECDKSVNAIMEGVIKKAVQQYYSGIGRKVHGVAKRNFSATHSYACMKDVLEQKFETDAVKLKISSAAGTFLTLWRDREGGAAERRSRARANNAD